MLSRIRVVRQNSHGFTLTELLITIVILGVLAGIVVFAVRTFTSDSTKVACEADKKSVEIAADAYFAKNKVWPPGLTDAARIAALTPDYLKAPPKNNGYTITLSDVGVVGPATCP